VLRPRRSVPATGRAVDRVLRVIGFLHRGRALTGIRLTPPYSEHGGPVGLEYLASDERSGGPRLVLVYSR